MQLNKEVPFTTSNGGLVSAHDLAQYVFWTGDEAGAAQAIDDLIEKGLVSIIKCFSLIIFPSAELELIWGELNLLAQMSRENAIKFLRDTRMGIDYLQNAYAADQELSINKLPTEEKVSLG